MHEIQPSQSFGEGQAADPADTRARIYLERTEERIGNVLLKSRDRAGAIDNFRRALTVAQAAFESDRLNGWALSDIAALSSRLGECYAEVASSTPEDQKLKRWQEARVWYQKSVSMWLELRKRGSLPQREDGENPEKAEQGVVRCNAALAKLNAHAQ